MGKSSDQSYVIISYFPMCCKYMPKHKTIVDSPTMTQVESLCKVVTESSVDITGCLWTIGENSEFAPVFIVQNAEALHHDLSEWSENKHSKWFTLDWGVSEDRYALIIMPRLQESIDRFKLRCLMEREEFIDKQNTVILFQPLCFGSSPILKSGSKSNLIHADIPAEFASLSEAEQQKVMEASTSKMTAMLLGRLPTGSKRRIGLIDPDKIDTANLAIDGEPFWIGPLDVVPNSDYAMKHLQEQKKGHEHGD